MDSKNRQLITYYYERFALRNFDEKDVLGFLTLAGNDAQVEVLFSLRELVITRDTESPSVKPYFNRAHSIISRIGSGGPKEKN